MPSHESPHLFSIMEKTGVFYEILETELNKLTQSGLSALACTERSFMVCDKVIHMLETAFSYWLNKEAEAEILFFKILAPPFFTLRQYQTLMYNYLLFDPETEDSHAGFLSRQLVKTKKTLRDHEEFFRYYESGSEELDNTYFKRVSQQVFSTSGLVMISDIFAAQRFHDFLWSRQVTDGLPASPGGK